MAEILHIIIYLSRFCKMKVDFLLDCFLANISRERVISCETCGQRRKISLARAPFDGSCGLNDV